MNEFQPGANGITADERSPVYRVAWDFMGSMLGVRNELYERYYLASTKTNRIASHLFYSAANRARGDELFTSCSPTPGAAPERLNPHFVCAKRRNDPRFAT